MQNLIQQIFTILITPPGNLVYHLILAFSIVAALQAVQIGRRNSGFPNPSRILFGLILLLLAQLVLFLSSGLAWQQLANPQRFLPPLDRIVAAFSVLWMVWLWCFPRPSRFADTLTGLFSLALIILALFTLNAWMREDLALPFNASVYDLGWEVTCLSLAFIGILLLLILRPVGWGTGIAALGLILAGYVVNLLSITAVGDFSGILRLSQLCAFPLLPGLAQHFIPLPAEPALSAAVEEAAQKQTRSDPRLTQAWLQLAAEKDPAKIGTAIARVISQTLLADFCFLLSSPGEMGLWTLRGGYDQVAGEALPEITLEQEKIPTLAASLQRGRAIRLDSRATPPAADLKYIGSAFGLEDAGDLLSAPLISNGKVWGGIMVLSPYSTRLWSPEDQAFLSTAADTLILILQRTETPTPQAGQETDPLQQELAAATKQLNLLRQENQQLLLQVSEARIPAAPVEKSAELESLLAIQKEAQETIAGLQSENVMLHTALQHASASSKQSKDTSQMEAELRMTLEELAYLQNSLAEANMKILELQREPTRSTPASSQGMLRDPQEMLLSIAQDLRQPLTSIQGYSDLLLAESAGPLSAMQRGFLERIKPNVERVKMMLNDLIRTASLNSGQPALDVKPVDLSVVVDQAVAVNSSMLREKRLNLQIDLPDSLPSLKADQEALHQILTNLLCNAGSSTPENGTILLRIRCDTGDLAEPSLLMQIQDQGGGISDADLTKLFVPISRAETPLIEGVHDGGSGLFIANTLVKAQGGEIWAETEPGKTTMFNVRLPILINGKAGRPEPA
jgi:signal transduction histidine kinase